MAHSPQTAIIEFIIIKHDETGTTLELDRKNSTLLAANSEVRGFYSCVTFMCMCEAIILDSLCGFASRILQGDVHV